MTCPMFPKVPKVISKVFQTETQSFFRHTLYLYHGLEYMSTNVVEALEGVPKYEFMNPDPKQQENVVFFQLYTCFTTSVYSSSSTPVKFGI